MIGVGVLVGCIAPSRPAPAVIRVTAPPWDAPRDAVSYVGAAGLATEPLGTTGNAHAVQLGVTG